MSCYSNEPLNMITVYFLNVYDATGFVKEGDFIIYLFRKTDKFSRKFLAYISHRL